METLISIVIAVALTWLVFKFVPDVFVGILILIVFLIAYAFIRPRVGRSL